jgi:hypothetical protein
MKRNTGGADKGDHRHPDRPRSPRHRQDETGGGQRDGGRVACLQADADGHGKRDGQGPKQAD